MRSIRRSLIAYFLLLLALALGAVGVLVHQIAGDALRDREAISAERINTEYKDQCARADQQFNDSLEKQAEALGRELKWKYAFLYSPDRQRDADDLQRFRISMAVLPVGLGATSPWAGLYGTTVSATQIPQGQRGPPARNWLFWWFQSALTDEQVRRSFAEGEDHPKLFKFELPRSRVVLRGAHTSIELPPVDAAKADAVGSYASWHDDVTINGVVIRRVGIRYPLGGPIRGIGPSRLSIVEGTAGGMVYPLFWLVPHPDIDSVALIQVGRPRAELEPEFLRFAQHRDQSLEDVMATTRQSLTNLRNTLLLIAGLAFVALALGGWILVGFGLAPLKKLSDAVSQVSEKDFHLPIEQKELSRELLPIHDRLTHTLDALRRAFDREKQAVADISHELRTPLAALLSTLDVALRKPREAAQYKTTLEECRDISKQLSRLVERIMTLAYLDAGNDRTRTEPIDVGDLANECAAVIRPLAEAHGLTFRAAIDPTAQLDTDPDKLREVLMNLLHNAVEYNSTNGKIELRVARGRGAVTFEVRDTGIGMPPDVRTKIFERFYRADPSRHATGVHAGLGLSIVKEYIERLGGTIAVESTVGQGSTFRVSLPATDVPDTGADREPWPR